MNLIFEGIEIDLAKGAASSAFGVEKLKDTSVDIVRIWKRIKDRLESGDKFTFFEKLRTGVEVSSLGAEVVSNLEALKNEIIDLDPAEGKEVAEAVAEAFNISYTEAFDIVANIVVKTISIVIAVIDIYKSIKEL